MLLEVLNAIKDKLNNHIAPLVGKNPEQDKVVKLEDVARLAKGPEGSNDVEGEEANASIFITLANIEEENALKNNYPMKEQGGVLIASKPVLFLNLYLLIAANFNRYDEALKHISFVLGFFQANKTMTVALPNFPDPCTLTFNLHNISFEHLNNLWVVMGGQYRPSVLYKTKLLLVQESVEDGKYPILEINSNETLS
ncbi:MAG: DUF4255 domain-containing protein [Saprospiraceae bacterium]